MIQSALMDVNQEDYVTGKAIGLVVSLWSPTKIFKARQLQYFARTELAFKLNISSKLGLEERRTCQC